MKPVNTDLFFQSVRLSEFGGSLSQSQVDGINVLLEAMPSGWDLRWGAYLLATAFWETNHTVQPVREAYWLSEAWRRIHLRYYPFYGRGFCQLTWEQNYRFFGTLLSLDLVTSPDLALVPEHAAKIIVYGMEHGSFSGIGLEPFFNDKETNWVGARRVINGSDRADTIAVIAENVFAALTRRT